MESRERSKEKSDENERRVMTGRRGEDKGKKEKKEL